MPKEGIKFDYDLQANEELKEQDRCLICGKQLVCRWTDYSGEGVCISCGCPYQLKWGSDEQKKEGNYPYIGLRDEWIPILKEYWEETHQFTFLGMSFEERTGQAEFNKWLKEKHPELIKKE